MLCEVIRDGGRGFEKSSRLRLRDRQNISDLVKYLRLYEISHRRTATLFQDLRNKIEHQLRLNAENQSDQLQGAGLYPRLSSPHRQASEGQKVAASQ